MTVDATALPVATVPVVRAYIRQLQRRNHSDRVIGIRAQPVWNAERELHLEGATVHVRDCVSALAVREALVEHSQRPDGYLVVITDVDDDDLGHGLRSRLAGYILHPVKLWETVKESFDASHIDPLLAELKAWAPRALVDHEPTTGWPAAPGGTLTREFALGQLSGQLLGGDAGGQPYADGEHVDAQALLRWSLDPVAVGRWRELDPELRDGLSHWLAQRTGAAGEWTLRAVAAGHEADAVALGLVAGLLWHDASRGEASATARGQFIARLGGGEPKSALAWGRSAATFVSEQLLAGQPAAHSSVARAEKLLTGLGAGHLVVLSDQLPASFADRLRRFAVATRRAVETRTPEHVAAAETSHATVMAHDLAATDPRAQTATMALRLMRWLTTDDPTVDTLAQALDQQANSDAWVDRAYADVFTGDPDIEVAAAYAALTAAVRTRREAHDEQLARLLARVTEDDPDLGRIVPVEDALARVVAQLTAAGRNILLIVLDGMSTGVLTTLGEGLRARRWLELVDPELGRRQALLAALPTVTQVCRTSLLTGRLATGDQHDEKAGFATAVGDGKSRLFHKDDLRTPAGEALAPDVRAAIANPTARVVGVVLNTIDDTLDKMDPGGTTWTVDQVQHLPALTEAARIAERLLVLTADHGHVVERGSELRSNGDGGARWRPATAPAAKGEVVLRGRRVRLGGGKVVAPWREDIRYGPKKAGYHGGVSAAEVAVPLAVFDAGVGASVGTWVPASPPEPVWWLSPLTTELPRPLSTRTPTLFDGGEDAAPAGESLIDALLASEVYAAQRRRAGRAAPEDSRVRAIVEALLKHRGRLHETTLASTANIPAPRMRTVLAAVRRVLSVEGYEALGYDPDGITVVLDTTLLRQQFGLDPL